jgi:hypothetical protein
MLTHICLPGGRLVHGIMSSILMETCTCPLFAALS